MNQEIKLTQQFKIMDKTQFPHNPYLGMIFYNPYTEKTYEFINNPFYTNIPGVKPKTCWIDISKELL